MQRAYLMALYELAQADTNVLSIIADNGTDFDSLMKEELPNQFLDFGISEQHMVAAAAGLASCGKKPFVYTAGAFLAYRSYEFIRNDLCLQNMNVTVVGNGAGLSISTLGPTHHTTEDIGALRSIPNLTIFTPASPMEVRKVVLAAYSINGPVYIRLGMGGEPELYKGDYSFSPGKAVTMAKGDDIIIFTTGSITSQVLEAARLLGHQGISAGVINMHTIKPLDTNAILKSAQNSKVLFTVEEHNILGGLGAAVAEVLVEHGSGKRLHRIGLNDVFAKDYGTLAAVRNANGLDTEGIVAQIKAVI